MNEVKAKYVYEISYNTKAHKGGVSFESCEFIHLSKCFPNFAFHGLELIDDENPNSRRIIMKLYDTRHEFGPDEEWGECEIEAEFDKCPHSYWYYKDFDRLWNFIKYNRDINKRFGISRAVAYSNGDGAVCVKITLYAR